MKNLLQNASKKWGTFKLDRKIILVEATNQRIPRVGFFLTELSRIIHARRLPKVNFLKTITSWSIRCYSFSEIRPFLSVLPSAWKAFKRCFNLSKFGISWRSVVRRILTSPNNSFFPTCRSVIQANVSRVAPDWDLWRRSTDWPTAVGASFSE